MGFDGEIYRIISNMALNNVSIILLKTKGGIGMAEEFYCMKCRKKVQVENFEKKTLETKTGKRTQLVGKCPSCGGNVYKFVKG
jgi:acetyl-CoA carboxylase beta subunit